MLKLSMTLAAVFAIAAHAHVTPPKGQYPHLNSTYSVPSFPSHGASDIPHSAPSGTKPNSPITPTLSSGTGSSSTALSSAASGGFSQSPVGTGSGILSSNVPSNGPTAPYPTGGSASAPVGTGSGSPSSDTSINGPTAPYPTGSTPIGTGSGPGSPSSDSPINGPVAPYPTGGSAPAPIGSGTAPAGTGASGPSNGGGSPLQSGDIVVTYTEGAGPSATVKTKTIKNTKYATNYETVYVKPTAAGPSGTEESASPVDSPEQNGSNGNSITATSQTYQTSTNYVNGASGAPGSSPSGCPKPVTVTVKGPDVTVTVSAMNGSPSGVSGPSSPESVSPESSGPASPPYPTAPFGNGTVPMSGTVSKKKCQSTGFVTKPSASATFKMPPVSSDGFPIAAAYAKRR